MNIFRLFLSVFFCGWLAACPVFAAQPVQDALYDENVRFARALEEKGARLRFDHWEGTHSWELWDRSVKQTMELFFENRR